MALTVEIHSESPGQDHKTIVLSKTGPDTGHISIDSAAAASERFDLYAIAADPALIELTCKAKLFFSPPDIAISVQKHLDNQSVVATITVSHALFGNGTTDYKIRNGEDDLLKAFLVQAAFPQL